MSGERQRDVRHRRYLSPSEGPFLLDVSVQEEEETCPYLLLKVVSLSSPRRLVRRLFGALGKLPSLLANGFRCRRPMERAQIPLGRESIEDLWPIILIFHGKKTGP